MDPVVIALAQLVRDRWMSVSTKRAERSPREVHRDGDQDGRTGIREAIGPTGLRSDAGSARTAGRSRDPNRVKGVEVPYHGLCAQGPPFGDDPVRTGCCRRTLGEGRRHRAEPFPLALDEQRSVRAASL